MKKLLFLFLLAASLHAQIPSGFVQTTATVAALANGTYGAAWTNLSSSPQLPLLGGLSPFQQTVNGKMDSNGHFSVLLADTTQIIPNPSTWTFTFTFSCSAGGASGPGGFMTAVAVTGGGGTQDITAQITAALPSNPCSGGTGSVVPGTVGCTPTFISTSSLGGCAGTTMVNVMTLGCKVDGVTDDTACWNAVAANLNGKTYYLPVGTGCSIINGFINIGSPIYLPGGFRIIGAAKSAVGSCIQQNTNGVGIFQFVRELTNSFDIEYINFTAKNQQSPATSQTADTAATAILFNPATHIAGGEFNFNISNNTFGNFARGIGVQKQVASAPVSNPVWGFNIDNNIAFGSLTGALFNLLSGSAVGSPRCSFHGNYATNANTTEPQFVEGYCDAFKFDNNESNNGLNTIANFGGNLSGGDITGFHIEAHTMTVSGTPIVTLENSNMVISEVNIASHVCPALNCGTNPEINAFSDVAGGGSLNVNQVIFGAYPDSTPGYIADAVRVGSNAINPASTIGVTSGFTNTLRPGDASNSLFAQVGATYNVASQLTGFYKTNQLTPQPLTLTTFGAPQSMIAFGGATIGPGLIYYATFGDAVHWKPGTIEMGNDGQFHLKNCPNITVIPTGVGAYPASCVDTFSFTGNGSFGASFSSTGLTANRAFALPDASGTLGFIPQAIGMLTLSGGGSSSISTAAACSPSATCTYYLTNCGPSGSQTGTPAVSAVVPGVSFNVSSFGNAGTLLTGDNSKICWRIN